MAETSGPFDGSPWAQSQWYDTAPAWAPSAVIGSPASTVAGGSLGLSINGLSLTLAIGQATVKGAGYKNTTTKALTVAPNTNSSLSRWDRIVLRRDLAAKTVTAVLLQGTPAASPVAVAPTEVDTGIWDVPLFSFLVPPNSGTTLTGIRDERIFVDRSGQLAVYSSATLSYLSATPNGARVWAETPGVFYARMNALWTPEPFHDPATGRVFRWDGTQAVKIGGAIESLYENGAFGNSGSAPAGNGVAVGSHQTLTAPVATSCARVDVTVSVVSANSSIGRILVHWGNTVLFSTVFNVGTSQVSVPRGENVTLPAGAADFWVELVVDSGGSVSAVWSAVTVTV